MMLGFSLLQGADDDTDTDSVDSLRQRLADSDAALRLHVELANDLAAQLGDATVTRAVASAACQTMAGPDLHGMPVEGAIRALCGHARRTLCRRVLSAWRSHCEKVLMLRNMRRMAEMHVSPAHEGGSEPPSSPPHATPPRFPAPPAFPAPPPDRRRQSSDSPSLGHNMPGALHSRGAN